MQATQRPFSVGERSCGSGGHESAEHCDANDGTESAGGLLNSGRGTGEFDRCVADRG
jgi:hypothetical protein